MHLRPLILLGLIVSMVTGVALGVSAHRAWPQHNGKDASAERFQRVLSHIEESYVDEVTKQKLYEGALKGMLDGLDPHSAYLDTQRYEGLKTDTSGTYGGIGVELGLVDDYFTVIAPIDNSPASRAGMQAGDRLIGIDDEPLKGNTLTQVQTSLRGKPGGKIDLEVLRDKQVLNFSITRSIITTPSVHGELLEPDYGYLRISQFQVRTEKEIKQQTKRLLTENKRPLKGLVLDLRNNPGGVLQASVAVADQFLSKGMIVYTEGRLPSSHSRYRASGKDALEGAPLVVLINQGSASASEIVAGALKDQQRATLIGEVSYGKGSVQSVLPLGDHHGIKLTTAYYFTPSGTTIHKQGIVPDIEFATDEDAPLLERALAHLKSPESLHARLAD